jgi:hypothetical protein
MIVRSTTDEQSAPQPVEATPQPVAILHPHAQSARTAEGATKQAAATIHDPSVLVIWPHPFYNQRSEDVQPELRLSFESEFSAERD